MKTRKYKEFKTYLKRSWTLQIVIVALLIAGFTSCQKLLTVKPVDYVSDTYAITDSASAGNALRGAYRAVAAGGYYGATWQLDIIMSGNALNYTQSGASALEFLYHTITSDNGDLESIWAAEYTAINSANWVINQVPTIAVSATFSQAYHNQLIGEAYFIRALSYFDLARTFGGVQLFLTPTLQVSDKLGHPRSTLAQTYAQVLSDLTAAEGLLPTKTVRDRATVPTVWALLARVYLYQQQWSSAEAEATKLISDSTNYKLVKPYNTFFTSTNTTESVFELSYSAQTPNSLFSSYEVGGDYLANDSITAALENPLIGGTRNSLIKTQSSGSTLVVLYPQSNGSNSTYVIRIAELWLIRAEARAQQGNLSGAVSDLNAVRNRAGLANETATTQATILLAIENERRVEFAFEPQRWFDLIRTGRAPAVLGITNPEAYLFPIPAQELTEDPSLVQNPGY